MDSVVSCKNLYKTFGTGDLAVHALQGVDLEVKRGGFVCLSGPSGSGKTTLLNMIGGLDTPSSGEIIVAGSKVHELDKGDLAKLRLTKVGFIFQAYNLIPVLTARENVEFVMQLQGVDKQLRREKSMSLLEEVGLKGMEDRRPGELSGGQQQRVAVARAIVSHPEIVLADEPTANLDSHTAENLMKMLVKLNEAHEITFIISTHDSLVMSYAKRLIKLHDGKIAVDESNKKA